MRLALPQRARKRGGWSPRHQLASCLQQCTRRHVSAATLTEAASFCDGIRSACCVMGRICSRLPRTHLGPCISIPQMRSVSMPAPRRISCIRTTVAVCHRFRAAAGLTGLCPAARIAKCVRGWVSRLLNSCSRFQVSTGTRGTTRAPQSALRACTRQELCAPLVLMQPRP